MRILSLAQGAIAVWSCPTFDFRSSPPSISVPVPTLLRQPTVYLPKLLTEALLERKLLDSLFKMSPSSSRPGKVLGSLHSPIQLLFLRPHPSQSESWDEVFILKEAASFLAYSHTNSLHSAAQPCLQHQLRATAKQ